MTILFQPLRNTSPSAARYLNRLHHFDSIFVNKSIFLPFPGPNGQASSPVGETQTHVRRLSAPPGAHNGVNNGTGNGVCAHPAAKNASGKSPRPGARALNLARIKITAFSNRKSARESPLVAPATTASGNGYAGGENGGIDTIFEGVAVEIQAPAGVIVTNHSDLEARKVKSKVEENGQVRLETGQGCSAAVRENNNLGRSDLLQPLQVKTTVL